MEIAAELGCTLTELNRRMSSKEFTLWVARHQLQPRGVKRDNYHFAMLCSLLANINAPRGKSFSIDDFMYSDQQTKRESNLSGFLSRMRAQAKPEK